MLNIVKIADKEQGFFRLFGLAHEHGKAFFVVGTVDPLEALRIIILLIHRRMFTVEGI